MPARTDYIAVPARRILPGATVPPVQPGDYRQHIVKDVAAAPDHYGHLLITTNMGEWVVHPDSKFSFPRRPDGSVIDWRTMGRDPLPKELAIGDTLRSALDPPWERGEFDDFLRLYGVAFFDELPANVQAEQRRHFIDLATQEVLSIAAQSLEHLEWSITTYDNTTRTTRTYVCHAMAPLTFPRIKARVYDPLAQERGYRTVYGPYVSDVERRPGVFFFATHPTGRGRWPAHLVSPFEMEHGSHDTHHVTRPPRAHEWPSFFYSPNIEAKQHVEEEYEVVTERHPKDPRRRRSS